MCRIGTQLISFNLHVFAKAYRAEVTAGYEQQPETKPVVQPKMTQALSQYEALPATYTTRGGLTITMNRKSLIEVANRDSFAFREIDRGPTQA